MDSVVLMGHVAPRAVTATTEISAPPISVTLSTNAVTHTTLSNAKSQTATEAHIQRLRPVSAVPAAREEQSANAQAPTHASITAVATMAAS